MGNPVAFDAKADDRETRGFISMTTKRPVAGSTANCTFDPPVSTPISRPLGPGTWRNDRLLTYLESKDGVKWQRPKLSLVPWKGNQETNILMDIWCSYASVNIDPKRTLPYEMFVFRHPTYLGAKGRIPGLALPAGKKTHPYGLYRFRSPDGRLDSGWPSRGPATAPFVTGWVPDNRFAVSGERTLLCV